jgi:GNAT superfamily N-acetyltransferase
MGTQAADSLDLFPKALTLDDGTTVTVRPLRAGDGAALLGFFRGIPAVDRYWLREDVTDSAVIDRWVADLDYQRVLPLVALRDEEIVADATLHRRGYGARRFNAEVRMVVAPSFRGRGLGYALLAELHDLALAVGLERLEAEIVSGAQVAAREAVELFGFREAAVMRDHLRGPAGEPHDLLVLVYQLERAPL